MDNERFLDALKQALDQKKGEDIQVIDLRNRAMFADFFLLATGTSRTHVAALAQEVDRIATVHQVHVLGTEGLSEASWVLLDLGDVVVHLFQRQTRAFFNLEKLWSPRTMMLTHPMPSIEVGEG
ncbi:MAG: ribosome silencing factor [Magnetococcales bacterium]|nr:ribosome silencing factor [Magnetococcales bacterium]MBF0149197.1 ribosome silencing factor [Magnetococcales bacterium]MBF0174510.1 ribosome silencing factor [Magnetococcales bacterium]MBF0348455.1 ribosome silencing factor [Magnetococcales bacterium]MBF0632515.1 ribosome silencing factor [Magnetococcales bacterium]